MSQKRTVTKDGRELSYILTRRPARRITIRVTGEGEVRVSAPTRAPQREIDGAVKKHFASLLEALAASAPPPALGEGSTVFYLGESYRLTLRTGKTAISFEGGVATLTLPSTDADAEGAYEKACRPLFLALITERCLAFEERYPAFAPKRKEIRVRSMKNVWGNCRPDRGILTFSTKLLRFPVSLIDSVVAHKYTHFFHRGHDGAFYRALLAVCPLYRECKRALEAQHKEQRKEMAK